MDTSFQLEKQRHTLNYMRTTFIMFSRNGRWGTCSDCPQDSTGMKYPEFCKYTTRYDHHLNIDGLSQQYKNHLQ